MSVRLSRLSLLSALSGLSVLSASLAVLSAVAVAAGAPQRSGAASAADIDDAMRAAAAFAIVDLRSNATVDQWRADRLLEPAWPGSIAKLATYTAAIDAGKLTGRTQIVCTRHVTLRDGRHVDCSHPPTASALSLREAVALSCNVFAATIARNLTHAELAAAFTRLGLPAPPPDADRVGVALGLEGTQVRPRQLLDALVRATSPRDADPKISAARALLRDGLHESARTGTASALGAAGIDALAKTGTAPMRGGIPLGLVVALTPADSPRTGIIVALPGGAGADAAEVAATLLRRRAAIQSGELHLRVGTPTAAGGYRVEPVPLEEYVARVVAGETSNATPQAARDALAITARTYALANRGRHASNGFDLCTLTHCQVLRPATADSRAAAQRTRDRVLTRGDATNALAPVFYSAACGGQLEDASALLPNMPAGALPWMTSRPDPAGIAEPDWHAELTAADLLAALHASGIHGDVLRDLTVRPSATGRVTSIALAGLTPDTIDADDFRRIIGQRMGWQLLKSLRFTVQRTARGYRFDGRGHGHAVGLCVLGASHLAAQGKTTDDLLRVYFPGLKVVTFHEDAAPTTTPRPKPIPTQIDVRLPASEEGEREHLRMMIANDLSDIAPFLHVKLPQRVSVIVYPTVDSYSRATHKPWWTSGATVLGERRATIHLIPLDALRRARRLEMTLRHEVVHVLTASQLRTRPLWVQEGVASFFGVELLQANLECENNVCPSDDAFRRAPTPEAFHRAYACAMLCVSQATACGVDWRVIGEAWTAGHSSGAACAPARFSGVGGTGTRTPTGSAPPP